MLYYVLIKFNEIILHLRTTTSKLKYTYNFYEVSTDRWKWTAESSPGNLISLKISCGMRIQFLDVSVLKSYISDLKTPSTPRTVIWNGPAVFPSFLAKIKIIITFKMYCGPYYIYCRFQSKSVLS